MTTTKIMGVIYLWNVLYLWWLLVSADAGFIQYCNLLGAVAFGCWLAKP